MGRLLTLLASLLAGACGNESEHATGDTDVGGEELSTSAPLRDVVVERDFAWQLDPGGSAPLSRHWLFTQADRSVEPDVWRVDAGPAVRSPDGLTLTGSESILSGPHDAVVDTRLQQRLVVHLDAHDATRMIVTWSLGPDGRELRTTTALQGDGRTRSVSVRLRGQPGAPGAATLGEVRDGLRIQFESAPGGSPRVNVRRIALLSDFDQGDADGTSGPRPATARRLGLDGVFHRGLAVPARGRLLTSIERPRQPLRLCFSLAAVGAPLDVDVAVAGQPGTFHCRPEAGWSAFRLGIGATEPGPPVPFSFSVRLADDAPPGARGVLLIGSVLAVQQQPSTLPHVVLYLEDTLRADHLGLYGHERETDEHLQRMAADGAVFTRTFANSNWTRPSVTSLLTSLLPVAHGNHDHRRRISTEVVTLAERLADAGYLTAAFVTNHHAGSWSGLEQGFDIHAEPDAYGASTIPSTLTSDVIAGPVADLLRQAGDTPLFLYVHSMDPHAPYEPPWDDLLAVADAPLREILGEDPPVDGASFDPQRVEDALRALDSRPAITDGPFPLASLPYDGEIRVNDRSLAALDATLDELGRRDDTLFVFTSDHGEAFGEHGQWQHHQSLYQEELAVPWVVRWPGRIVPGEIDTPASLIDVAPTILGLIGIDAPDGWRGRDLAAQCREIAARARHEPARPLFAHTLYDEPSGRAGTEVAVVLWPLKLIAEVRDDDFIPRELYELQSDPDETRNRLGDPELARARDHLSAAGRAMLAWDTAARGADTQAAEMDDALREWMKQMGYLR